MEQAILDYLAARTRATFAELAADIDGFNGEYAVGSSVFPSVILWRRVSEAAVRALWALERNGRIRFEPAQPDAYTPEHRERIALPVAEALKEHPAPHWYPVIVSVVTRRKARSAAKA